MFPEQVQLLLYFSNKFFNSASVFNTLSNINSAFRLVRSEEYIAKLSAWIALSNAKLAFSWASSKIISAVLILLVMSLSYVFNFGNSA